MSEYLLTSEVAEKYRKSEKTIRRWRKIGIYGKKLHGRRVGKNYLFNSETVDKFVYETGQSA